MIQLAQGLSTFTTLGLVSSMLRKKRHDNWGLALFRVFKTHETLCHRIPLLLRVWRTGDQGELVSSETLITKRTGFCHKRKHLANTVPFVCYLRKASGGRMRNYEERCQGADKFGYQPGLCIFQGRCSLLYLEYQEPTAPKGCKSKHV